MKENVILVSACLLNEKCRYNGTAAHNKRVEEFVKDKKVVKICPEVLGGLPIPRASAERLKDKIITSQNEDVSDEFHKGAQEVMKLLSDYNVEVAILKSKSPSCGKGKIYDGSFSGNLILGNGVCTEYLLAKNINVLSDDEL